MSFGTFLADAIKAGLLFAKSGTATPGSPATIAVPDGYTLIVSGAAASSGTVTRSGSSDTWPIAAGPRSIGPYEGLQTYTIACAAGSISAKILPMGTKASQSNRYMIASNRFGFPTDWATVDTAKNSDGTFQDGRTGGTGTAASKWQRRRFTFTTTWVPKGGRLLWANCSNGVSGILPSLFTLTVQRVEIRLASDGSLVDTIKFSSSGSKTFAAGEFLWSDVQADLLAGTTYFADLYYLPADHSSFPACAPIYLDGEVAGESLGTDLSLGSMGTGIGTSVGGYFGPVAFVAKGWDGITPVAMIFGDSITDYTSSSATLATKRGDGDHVQMALGDVNSGAWNHATSARYSADFTATYTDNLNSLGGKNIIDWFADACALLQAEPVFNVAIVAHGRNNLTGSSTLASIKANVAGFISKLASRYSYVPSWLLTIPPYTTASGNTAGTTEAAQTPINTPNTDSAVGVIRQYNDWVMTGGGGLFAGGIDTASACRGRAYDKWKEVPFSATLITAVTANTTNVVTISAPPPLGECLVFEPGVANVDAANGARVYCAAKVTANGANWDVMLNGRRGGQANPPTLFDGSTVKLAHSAGVALAISSSPDLLHPSPARKADMAKVTIARKPAIAASVLV